MNLKIIILHDSDLSDVSVSKLKAIEDVCVNTFIELKMIDDHYFLGIEVSGYVSMCSFYRLIMYVVVAEDKCLFLNGDMIIQSDLQELFSVDINDCYSVGVCDT